MKDSNLYILLSIIKNNGDTKRLLREGLDYIQIAELTNLAISEGYLLYESQRLRLSEIGEKKFNIIESNSKSVIKDNWIDKEKKSKIPQLDKKFIFLPHQDELDF